MYCVTNLLLYSGRYMFTALEIRTEIIGDWWEHSLMSIGSMKMFPIQYVVNTYWGNALEYFVRKGTFKSSAFYNTRMGNG